MSSFPEPTTWYPADLFSSTPHSSTPLSLIILNQPLTLPSPLYSLLWSNTTYRVAADGGANSLYQKNLTSSTPLPLDLIIGDLDSVTPATETYWKSKNTPIIHDSDQYSTDFTKAVNHIQQKFPSPPPDIIALGGLGGRIDQGLSTLHHLYLFQSSPSYSTGKMYLLSSESITFILQPGLHRIKLKQEFQGGRLGKHVGIIPMKGKCRISTKGLEWDVEDWETEMGGQVSTSNHVKEEWCEVKTDGDVVFTVDLVVDGGEGSG